MVKNAMPKSKAKTAYGLLTEIRKLILDEPKRYNQEYEVLVDAEIELLNIPADQRPACGTIGCVAGWAVVLKHGRKSYNDAVPQAKALLGLNDDQFQELYDYRAVPKRSVIGAEEHANAGAKHIAAFQKKYVAQLKAKRV